MRICFILAFYTELWKRLFAVGWSDADNLPPDMDCGLFSKVEREILAEKRKIFTLADR